MAKTVTGTAQASQHLKRANRIVHKLLREPNMRLSQMQDVGGCRVVVPTLTELRALQGRLLDRYSDGVKVDDYIARPKKSGYRGAHVMAQKRYHVWTTGSRSRTTSCHA